MQISVIGKSSEPTPHRGGGLSADKREAKRGLANIH